MVSEVVFHRREAVRVSEVGVVHPRDAPLPATAHTPFLTQSILADRIATIAQHIAKDYWGKSVQLVPVLQGAIPFSNALVHELHRLRAQFTVDPVRISSYHGDMAGTHTLHEDVPKLQENVLIVDGIVDTGATAKFLLEHFHRRGAKHIGVCTLLHKKSATKNLLPLQYVGFDIPDVWIVGFGMDYEQQYREMP